MHRLGIMLIHSSTYIKVKLQLSLHCNLSIKNWEELFFTEIRLWKESMDRGGVWTLSPWTGNLCELFLSLVDGWVWTLSPWKGVMCKLWLHGQKTCMNSDFMDRRLEKCACHKVTLGLKFHFSLFISL